MAAESSGADSNEDSVTLASDDFGDIGRVEAATLWALGKVFETAAPLARLASQAPKTIRNYGEVALDVAGKGLQFVAYLLTLPWDDTQSPVSTELPICATGYLDVLYQIREPLYGGAWDRMNQTSNPPINEVEGPSGGVWYWKDTVGYNVFATNDPDSEVRVERVRCNPGSSPQPPPTVVNDYTYNYTHNDGNSYTVTLGDVHFEPSFAPVFVFFVTNNGSKKEYTSVYRQPDYKPVVGGPPGPPVLPPYEGPENPPPPEFDWGGFIDLMLDLAQYLQSIVPGTLYRLTSTCETNEQGEPLDKVVEVEIPSGTGLTPIAQRIDALVPLLQGQKDFRQEICKPVYKLEGREVTIRFKEPPDIAYRTGRKPPLEKVFTYRVMNESTTQEEQAGHWVGFYFQTGPIQVCFRGPWGAPQVWAASEAEGRRVLTKWFEISGVDPTKGEWSVAQAKPGRVGVMTRVVADTLSTRIGPSGRPFP